MGIEKGVVMVKKEIKRKSHGNRKIELCAQLSWSG